MTNRSRLFFALWPDDKTREAISHLRLSLNTNGFKWVKPNNFHITLVFLGSVDNNTAQLIKQSIANISVQPFTLYFNQLAYWRKPKILCLTCQQPTEIVKITNLATDIKKIAATFDLNTDTQPFTPHITLARDAFFLPEIHFEPIIWSADSFCLIESCAEPDGVCYKVIQQWALPTITEQTDVYTAGA